MHEHKTFVHHNADPKVLSALGQKQTFAVQNGMSALPPKADIAGKFATLGSGYLNAGTLVDDDPRETKSKAAGAFQSAVASYWSFRFEANQR